MVKDVNDFIVALLEASMGLHQEGEIIIAKGLTLKNDKDGVYVQGRGSCIYPKHYGFKAIKKGKEIYFNPINKPN
ncbi:hypothetical protein KKB43_04760 [Patescibacteria group bacterium]|nr:hypothetical protein [Patescibacteria group bacterium]